MRGRKTSVHRQQQNRDLFKSSSGRTAQAFGIESRNSAGIGKNHPQGDGQGSRRPLPDRGRGASGFKTIASIVIRSNGDVAECDPSSFFRGCRSECAPIEMGSDPSDRGAGFDDCKLDRSASVASRAVRANRSGQELLRQRRGCIARGHLLSSQQSPEAVGRPGSPVRAGSCTLGGSLSRNKQHRTSCGRTAGSCFAGRSPGPGERRQTGARRNCRHGEARLSGRDWFLPENPRPGTRVR